MDVTCPGATPLAGPPVGGPAAICGPLARDRDREGTVRQKGAEANVVFTSQHDPSVYYAACCGRYTLCEIWRAEKRRIWAERTTLEEDDARERREFAEEQRAIQREQGFSPLREIE